MSIDRIDFAALLCSRLCHDLLSPVGALNNGLELMADETDPQMRARCLDLLGESARTSANKLKFFRLAFGAAGGFGDAVPAHEIEEAIRGMFAGNARLAIGWLAEEKSLPKRAAKILLNLSLIGGEALVRGGQLDIGAERHDGVHELVVRAEGLKMVMDAEVRKALEGGLEDAEVSARTAAAWMVRALVDEAGGTLLLSQPEDPAILFGVRLPDRSLRRAAAAI